MTALRSRIRSRRRTAKPSFWAGLVTTLERAADDSATFCACDDGRACVA